MRPQLRGERSEGSDRGTTLVELLVAMSLTALVLAVVTSVFISATRSVRETQVRTATQADARTASEAMSRSLRVAVVPRGAAAGSSPFVTATASSVSFYANLQRTAVTYSTAGSTSAPVTRAQLQAPTLVTYAYDTTRRCITERQVPATTTSTGALAWTATPTPRCIASTTTAPVFTYYTSSLLTATGLSAPTGAQLGRVVSVGVQIRVVDPTASDVGASATTDRVTLVNVLAAQNGSS